jgi:ureidoglycolate dehydrogenase (NAD+)
MGRLTQARRAGQPIPAGLAIDEEGMPTTDPVRAAVPLPVGGPKGSGLSLMIECLTSLLLANPIIAEALGGTAAGRRHRQNGLVLAIDLARFGDPTVFRAEVERLIRTIKALPRDPAVEEILVPGERGDRTFDQRSRDGIPLVPATVAELDRIAKRFGVPPISG